MVIVLLEGIIEANVIQIAEVPTPMPQPDNSLLDFTVTCKGA